jgi:transcriptional regulator with XRE-family HTH domain
LAKEGVLTERIYMNSGELIRKARENKGLNQTQLADKVGVSRSMISQLETGKAYPSIEILLSIASQLGINDQILMDAYYTDKQTEMSNRQSKRYTQLKARINIETEMTAKLTRLIHVPILGSVPAGPLAEVLPKMRSEAEEWEYLDEDKATNPELVFGLHVVG